jgi:hypothetical protein
MQPSRLKIIKIKLPCWQSHYNYIFKIILNWKSKFRGPLSQATASKHSDAFTFTLLLSEGRAGEAWEPSYKIMLFPLPTIKRLSLLPGLFTFIYSSTFCFSLSLSLSDSHSQGGCILVIRRSPQGWSLRRLEVPWGSYPQKYLTTNA